MDADDVSDSVLNIMDEVVGITVEQHIPPDSLDAWELVHRGLAHFYRINREDRMEAIRLFKEATVVDPDFAAAHAHLAKVFDRAGFDTRRGSMWFAKGDDVPPDCQTCGRVNPAIGAYGCPMLVRPRPFVATLPSRHDDAKADATRPGPISDSQPTKRDRERAWERAWERASSPKTSSVLETAILADGTSTVGHIQSDAKRERAPRRDARLRHKPKLSQKQFHSTGGSLSASLTSPTCSSACTAP